MKVVRILLIVILLTFSNSFAERTFYTIQVASVLDFGAAEKIYKEVEKLPYARVDYVDGRYKVRIGFFYSVKEAKSFLFERDIRKKFKDAYVTRVYNSGYINTVLGKSVFPLNETDNSTNANVTENSSLSKTLCSLDNNSGEVESEQLNETSENQTLEKTLISNQTSGIEENISKVKKVVAIDLEKVKSVPKKNSNKIDIKVFSFIIVVPFLIIAIYFLLRIFRPKKNKGIIEKDFHQYLSELFTLGKFSELLDAASIYLLKVPDDTFVKELYAQGLKEIGRNLEAAEAFFELAKIFGDRGDLELAEKFRVEGEKLIDKEFGG